MPVLYSDKDGKDFDECLKLAEEFIADGVNQDKFEMLLKEQNYTSKAISLVLEKLNIDSHTKKTEKAERKYRVDNIVIKIISVLLLITGTIYGYNILKDTYSFSKIITAFIVISSEFLMQYVVVDILTNKNDNQYTQLTKFEKFFVVAIIVLVPMFFYPGLNFIGAIIRVLLISMIGFLYLNIDSGKVFLMTILMEGISVGVYYLGSAILVV